MVGEHLVHIVIEDNIAIVLDVDKSHGKTADEFFFCDIGAVAVAVLVPFPYFHFSVFVRHLFGGVFSESPVPSGGFLHYFVQACQRFICRVAVCTVYIKIYECFCIKPFYASFIRVVLFGVLQRERAKGDVYGKGLGLSSEQFLYRHFILLCLGGGCVFGRSAWVSLKGIFFAASAAPSRHTWGTLGAWACHFLVHSQRDRAW